MILTHIIPLQMLIGCVRPPSLAVSVQYLPDYQQDLLDTALVFYIMILLTHS